MAVNPAAFAEGSRAFSADVAFLFASSAHPLDSWVIENCSVSTDSNVVRYGIVFLHSDLHVAGTSANGWLRLERCMSDFCDGSMVAEALGEGFIRDAGR